jgi:hypothetical protein
MKKIILFIVPLLFLIYLFPSPKKEKILEDKVSIKASAIMPSKTNPSTPKKAIKPLEDPKERKDRIEKEVEGILAATNLWEDLKSIDGLMEDRLDKARDLLPPEEYEKLEKIIKENFSGAKFAEEVKTYLAEQLTDKDLADLNKLTQDPFLKKIWEIQDRASNIESEKEMAEFAKDFSPTPEREKLVEEYEKSAGATSRMMDLNSEFLQGILKGASPKEISTEQLKMVAEKITEKIRPSIKDEVILRLHYTYQDLTDEEFKTLRLKDENPTLTKTENLIQEKLRNLLFHGGEEVGKLHKGTRI